MGLPSSRRALGATIRAASGFIPSSGTLRSVSTAGSQVNDEHGSACSETPSRIACARSNFVHRYLTPYAKPRLNSVLFAES